MLRTGDIFKSGNGVSAISASRSTVRKINILSTIGVGIIKRIGTVAARKGVIPLTAGNHVIASTPIKGVIACATAKCIGTRRTGNHVIGIRTGNVFNAI